MTVNTKKRFLNKTLPAGFKIPKQAASRFKPDESLAIKEGLAALRHGIERCQSESSRAAHPLFDDLPREDWDRFNLRHAELHMSFVIPA